ncbi:DUF3152 domain-containing protein [Kineosporia sp. NBRC 101731]|uniref:DUF3152 domain-containing protein n=1 Tax=Kineosporia sp. NBRC 101731 TaxID=3032199 RepID=UPI00249FCEA5|nr:DUF3152 domain-containing protein [Kineosporia sp. NBRC 101731]GLY29785.1 hypothetical protein Kisp02_31500 [Kineosporia sp. NBRC 101731]
MQVDTTPSTRRTGRRLVGALGSAALLAMTGCAPAPHPVASAPVGLARAASTSPEPSTTVEVVPSSSPSPPVTYPRSGSGRWRTASREARVAGDRGPLRRYRVAVERGITGVRIEDFADRVTKTLADGRGWTVTGEVRLQRVGPQDPYDFTIYLATPGTRDELCGDAAAGEVDEYTSCRNGPSVVLNVARWVHGVPGYGASLGTYRSYMINHETGHALGHHHELCPGPGRKAPVMEQQTLGLHGCVANGWPVVRGKLLSGAPGQYNDPVPAP